MVALAGATTVQAVQAPLYDPSADAIEQLRAAGEEARRTNRRVLAVIGGNWCKWCRALDGLLAADEELRDAFDAGFVVVHVNYSKENKNPAAMEMLGHPEEHGFPVLVVLSSSLEILHTQETESLETGDADRPGHDPAKVLAFAMAWRAAGRG